MLFLLRFRKGQIGATSAYIEISNPSGNPVINQRVAEEIGQKFCDSNFNHKYIKVEPAVIADESILDPKRLKELLHPPQPKPVRLSAEEQRELDKQEAEDPSNPKSPAATAKVVDEESDEEPASEEEDAAEEVDEDEVEADEEPKGRSRKRAHKAPPVGNTGKSKKR